MCNLNFSSNGSCWRFYLSFKIKIRFIDVILNRSLCQKYARITHRNRIHSTFILRSFGVLCIHISSLFSFALISWLSSNAFVVQCSIKKERLAASHLAHLLRTMLKSTYVICYVYIFRCMCVCVVILTLNCTYIKLYGMCTRRCCYGLCCCCSLYFIFLHTTICLTRIRIAPNTLLYYYYFLLRMRERDTTTTLDSRYVVSLRAKRNIHIHRFVRRSVKLILYVSRTQTHSIT